MLLFYFIFGGYRLRLVFSKSLNHTLLLSSYYFIKGNLKMKKGAFLFSIRFFFHGKEKVMPFSLKKK